MLWFMAICDNIFNNLDGIDKFLERWTLPKLTEEYIDYLDSPVLLKI